MYLIVSDSFFYPSKLANNKQLEDNNQYFRNVLSLR